MRLFKKRQTASDLGAAVFQAVLAIPPESKFRHSDREFVELVIFRAFAADHTLWLAIRDEILRDRIRTQFNRELVTFLQRNPWHPDPLRLFQERFVAYQKAVNTPDHNGPAFALSSQFVRFWQRTNDEDLDIFDVVEATMEYKALFETVLDVIRSVKIAG